MLSESAIPWLVLEVSWSLVYVALVEGLGLLCYRRSPFLVDCLIDIWIRLLSDFARVRNDKVSSATEVFFEIRVRSY